MGRQTSCEHYGITCKAFAGTAIMKKHTTNLQYAKTAGIPNGEKAQKREGAKMLQLTASPNRTKSAREFFT
jgi:hypothetical protein